MGREPPRVVCRCGRPRRPCTSPAGSTLRQTAFAGGPVWDPRCGPRFLGRWSHSRIPTGSPSCGRSP
eukprot:14297190-Heterocapsa_arctica.AAC.1